MIGILNKVISLAASLPFLKKAAGKLTPGAIIAGAGAIIAGNVAPHVLTDQNLVDAIKACAEVITALATLVSAFGFGRRAERVTQ